MVYQVLGGHAKGERVVVAGFRGIPLPSSGQGRRMETIENSNAG